MSGRTEHFADRPRPAVVVTGMSAACAAGRGTGALLAHALAGRPGFAPLTRFDPARYRTGVAAVLPDAGPLADELAGAIDQACADARLPAALRAGCPLLLAAHRVPHTSRLSAPDRRAADARGGLARALADRTGLRGQVRTYVTACVSASTAVADGAAMIASGRAERVVVAAGYLVTEDDFALFDSGRALARDGRVRPFSAGRQGLLLGDAVAAVVLESAARTNTAAGRGADVHAHLAGWGRAGDAHHVCRPHPRGTGLARAVAAALRRAAVVPADIGYVNAHGSATSWNDPAEAAGLHSALGEHAARVPISSTKSVHGHALDASGLLELVVTVQALRAGQLPVNAGFLAPDPACPLNVILDEPLRAEPRYALSVNTAFGGANTALLVEAA